MDIGPYVVLIAAALGIAVMAFRHQWWQVACCSMFALSFACRQVLDAPTFATPLLWIGIGILVVATYLYLRRKAQSQTQLW